MNINATPDQIAAMKTPVYKVEIIVIDFQNMSAEDVKYYLENSSRYLIVNVTKMQVKDAGEWRDDHPLNLKSTDASTYFDALPGTTSTVINMEESE